MLDVGAEARFALTGELGERFHLSLGVQHHRFLELDLDPRVWDNPFLINRESQSSPSFTT
jgi:hypothetical protein